MASRRPNRSPGDPGIALDEARSLAAAGDYAGALEKHVWFHENALRLRRSYYGVRLSFALADWVDLGKKYPPALAKLTSIRDENTTRLSAGEKNRDLFHDVASINQYLGEASATVALFKRLNSESSEFAQSVYNLADEDLVSAGEYELARNYLGDATRRLKQAENDFLSGMDYAREKKRTSAERAHKRIFTDTVLQIITVLRETGDTEGAKQIRAKALKNLDNREIRGIATGPKGD